tara:strand:+ start:766 stop:1350 length:585 start_codon:yes stop_codon:yes gene_type:complete
MAGAVLTGIATGLGAAGLEAAPTIAGHAVSNIHDKKYGTDDYLEAQGKVLSEKAKGLSQAERDQAMALAVRGIQAGAKGTEAELTRQAAASGGFGRSGDIEAQRAAVEKQKVEGAVRAGAGIDAASQQRLESEQGRISQAQAQAHATLEARRLEKMGRAQAYGEAAVTGLKTGFNTGTGVAQAGTTNVASALNK